MLVYKTKKADIRSKYRIYIECSVIIVLTILIAAFKYAPQKNYVEKKKKTSSEIIDIDHIQPTIQNTLPPRVSKPPIPIIANDDNFIDIPFEESDLDKYSNLTAPPIREEINRITVVDEDYIFRWSEELPEPLGGMSEIQKKVRYTEIARRAGIEGRVVIQAIVDENGKVIDAIIQQSLLSDLDRISLEAVRSTLFKPGKQRGKSVKVQISIPIVFKLH